MGNSMRVLMVTARLPATGHSPTLAPLVRQIESLRAAGLEVDVLQVRGLPALKYLQSLPRIPPPSGPRRRDPRPLFV